MKKYFVLFFLCISCLVTAGDFIVPVNPPPNILNSSIGPEKLENIYLSAGPTIEPSYVDHGSNVITVNACCITLYDNDHHAGLPKLYDFGIATFTLNVNTTNYIVGKYNNGSPILDLVTDVELINESDVVPILTIYDSAGYLHTLNWNTLGKGLVNKLHQRLVKTARYMREDGVVLVMNNPGVDLTFTVTAGRVWYGASRQPINAVISTTDRVVLVYPNGNTEDITALNNMNYVSSNTKQVLTPNRYTVNWVYRGIEEENHCYVMLGEGDYTLTEAQTAAIPVAPGLITSHAQLVAKVIIKKEALSPTSIQSAYEKTFGFSTAQIHNELSGLNDGDLFEHLTQIEKNQALVGSSTIDFSAKDGDFSGDVNIIGSFTLNGVDVLGDINAALTEILGE